MITLQRSKLNIMLPTENILWHTKHKYNKDGMDGILTYIMLPTAASLWPGFIVYSFAAILGKIILQPGFTVSFMVILGAVWEGSGSCGKG